MVRTAARRADARHVLPSARTVIALGTVYNTDRPYSTECADPLEARVSRYSWGLDYHAVIGTRTRQLLEWMREANGAPFEAAAYVDTGPVQERVYAQHAGLGWIGKNTCVINDELGSWLFLSEILCSLPLETDAPALDQCGTCTLCLDACPTGAIVDAWVLDATRCLSYLTIEVKRGIPDAQRSDIGAHVYGCDICQDVCPGMPSRVCQPTNAGSRTRRWTVRRSRTCGDYPMPRSRRWCAAARCRTLVSVTFDATSPLPLGTVARRRRRSRCRSR